MKLENMTEDTSPGLGSLVYSVKNPGTASNVDRKITLQNIRKIMYSAMDAYLLSDYLSLSAAVTALNALGTDCRLILDRSESLQINVSANNNIEVLPTPGNIITLGVYSLTVRKFAPTGPFQLDQVIFANVSNGYCVRAGDGATNWQCNQVFVENCALGYWIGDVVAYQDPYQNGMISITDGTFEGLSGDGKFLVTTLNGNISAGVRALTVTDSTGMAVGDPIYLDHGDSKFEMNRITDIDGNDITLAYDTEYTHLTNVTVVTGEIGVYCGYSSISSGRTTGIRLVRPMFDKIGCGIFAHDTECMDVYMPTFVTSMVRGLYIDGNVQNLNLVNPRVLDGMPADWKLFEITDRGGTYNFNWFGGADKSGISAPYINNQGDIDGFYIGSFAQSEGDSTFPEYFRGITFDGDDGIVLRETDGAVGLKYRSGAAPGNDNFTVTPEGLGKFASGIELPGGNIWMEDIAEPSAPATGGILFVERWDTPAKGHLYIKFPTGAKQLLATEP